MYMCIYIYVGLTLFLCAEDSPVEQVVAWVQRL